MATRTLTAGRDSLLGTTQGDTFEAGIGVNALGTPVNTLQTFDVLRGLGGTDELNAEIAVGGIFSSPNIRPTLLGVENVNITAVDEGILDNIDFGGGEESGISLGFNSRVTLDLRTSIATKTVSTVDSDAQLRVVNAGSVSTFGVTRFGSDRTDTALDVSGSRSTLLTVNVEDTPSTGGDSPAIRYDRGRTDFGKATINLDNSQVTLDGDSRVLEINSNAGSNNAVVVESSPEFLNIGGTRKLTLAGAGTINVGRAFSAKNNQGGVTVTDTIAGGLVLLVGSGKADSFSLIDSSSRLSAQLGAGDDVATINGDNGLTLDAGTGADSVVITALAGSQSDVLKMGDGDDSLDVTQAALDLSQNATPSDILDGGAGTDNLRLQLTGDVSAADGRHITNFESLTLADGANATVDLAGLPDVKTITIQGDDNLTFTNVTTGVTFNDVATGAVNNTLTFSAVGFGTPGAADLASLSVSVGVDAVNNAGGGSVTDSLVVNGFNAVNLTSKGGFGVVNPNDVTLTAAQSETLAISGQGDIDLHSATNGFTTISSTAATGDINLVGDVATTPGAAQAFNGVALGAGATSVTGGSGNDQLVGGDDADTFNLGSGGSDRVYFLNQGQSTPVAGQTDTVNGFDASGNDTLVFNGTQGDIFANSTVTGVQAGTAADGDATVELTFLGNAAGALAVTATLQAFAAGGANEDYGAVFDTASNTLFIDVNQNNAIGAEDLAVKLAGKAALSVADLQLAYFTV